MLSLCNDVAGHKPAVQPHALLLLAPCSLLLAASCSLLTTRPLLAVATAPSLRSPLLTLAALTGPLFVPSRSKLAGLRSQAQVSRCVRQELHATRLRAASFLRWDIPPVLYGGGRMRQASRAEVKKLKPCTVHRYPTLHTVHRRRLKEP